MIKYKLTYVNNNWYVFEIYDIKCFFNSVEVIYTNYLGRESYPIFIQYRERPGTSGCDFMLNDACIYLRENEAKKPSLINLNERQFKLFNHSIKLWSENNNEASGKQIFVDYDKI